MRARDSWKALVLSALLLGACGGEESADEETSSGGAPATEEAPAAGEAAPTEEAAAGEGQAGGMVVRDDEGDTVRIGPNGETVEAEDSETGETATVTQQDGTTAVEGGDGEQVVTNGEETSARDGDDSATIRRDGVVATDGEGNQVVIRRDGRGINVGGIRIGR